MWNCATLMCCNLWWNCLGECHWSILCVCGCYTRSIGWRFLKVKRIDELFSHLSRTASRKFYYNFIDKTIWFLIVHDFVWTTKTLQLICIKLNWVSNLFIKRWIIQCVSNFFVDLTNIFMLMESIFLINCLIV